MLRKAGANRQSDSTENAHWPNECHGHPNGRRLERRTWPTACSDSSMSTCLYSTVEGGRKAFYRLQLEILQHSDDESLLARNFNDDDWNRGGLTRGTVVAISQTARTTCGLNPVDRTSYSMANKGLHIELPNAKEYNRLPIGQQPSIKEHHRPLELRAIVRWTLWERIKWASTSVLVGLLSSLSLRRPAVQKRSLVQVRP